MFKRSTIIKTLRLAEEGLEYWEYGDDPRKAHHYLAPIKETIAKLDLTVQSYITARQANKGLDPDDMATPCDTEGPCEALFLSYCEGIEGSTYEGPATETDYYQIQILVSRYGAEEVARLIGHIFGASHN